MPDRGNIVLIGGSAGALKPLVEIAKALPKGFPAAIFVVIHAPPGARRLLTGIIGRSCALEVRYAEHDATFEPGCICVAPPDRHLLLSHDRMQVIRGPRENRSRPAIDPLFRTAARAFESRVAAVLLSGLLNDGTYGLMAVKQRGGCTTVQDPDEADYPDMPASAIENVGIDQVLPAAGIAGFLKDLPTDINAEEKTPMHGRRAVGSDRVEEPDGDSLDDPPAGELSPFVCPDCGGALWEMQDGKLIRYRCHVGHAFTVDVLHSAQQEALEGALWAALRALEEHVELSQRLAKRCGDAGHARLAQRHEQHAKDMEPHAAVMQRVHRGVSFDSARRFVSGTLASPYDCHHP